MGPTSPITYQIQPAHLPRLVEVTLDYHPSTVGSWNWATSYDGKPLDMGYADTEEGARQDAETSVEVADEISQRTAWAMARLLIEIMPHLSYANRAAALEREKQICSILSTFSPEARVALGLDGAITVPSPSITP